LREARSLDLSLKPLKRDPIWNEPEMMKLCFDHASEGRGKSDWSTSILESDLASLRRMLVSELNQLDEGWMILMASE
jgi:hypothetical protein